MSKKERFRDYYKYTKLYENSREEIDRLLLVKNLKEKEKVELEIKKEQINRELKNHEDDFLYKEEKIARIKKWFWGIFTFIIIALIPILVCFH